MYRCVVLGKRHSDFKQRTEDTQVSCKNNEDRSLLTTFAFTFGTQCALPKYINAERGVKSKARFLKKPWQLHANHKCERHSKAKQCSRSATAQFLSCSCKQSKVQACKLCSPCQLRVRHTRHSWCEWYKGTAHGKPAAVPACTKFMQGMVRTSLHSSALRSPVVHVMARHTHKATAHKHFLH